MKRQNGKVISWNDDKGFGFIKPYNGGKDVFAHINAFKKNSSRPEINQVVTYSITKDKRGRVCAERVLRAGDNKIKVSHNKTSSFSKTVFIVFVVLILIAVLMKKMSVYFLIYFTLVSFITFIIYALDKSAAKKGISRTPETSLHILALIGGWPGAMLAQQKLRHKTVKQPFRMIFWTTVFVNIGVLIWLLTPEGNKILQALIN
ncbi:MAG: DUF1294 domain-containing protein [Marinicellaceae bacterium]